MLIDGKDHHRSDSLMRIIVVVVSPKMTKKGLNVFSACTMFNFMFRSKLFLIKIP